MHGILIIRLKQPNRKKINDRILRAIAKRKEWPGHLVIMQDKYQRVWKAHYIKQ